jgi:hypothetical protein
MDLDIQKRERDLAIGTYGRGIYIADIYPFKEMASEVLADGPYLFDIQRTVQWNMRERRGPSYGEFARVNNPRNESTIYYYLPEKAKKVMLSIKDLAGETMQEIRGSGDAGLHSVAWNLRKAVSQDEGEQRGFRRRGAPTADPGLYKVTLMVDDEEIAIKDLLLVKDPILD